MGILTIMKLGVFVMCVLSLLFTMTWIMIYCPAKMLTPQAMYKSSSADAYEPGDNLPLKDYFDFHSNKLDNEIKNGKAHAGVHNSESRRKEQTIKKETVVPLELFKDEAFQSMIDQVEVQQLQGYEFLASSQNVTIYRQPRGDKGLYEYKLYAYLPDALPEQVAEVFLDNQYRVHWDQYVTELYMVQKNEKGPDVIYFNVDFPFPLTNRDYVYARETRRIEHKGEEHIVIVMHSVLQHNIPEKRGAIRVSDYHQSLAMKRAGPHGTKAFIQYYDDPKGSLPSWLVNWAAKTGVPAFLKDLQRATNGLEEFKKKHHRTAGVN